MRKLLFLCLLCLAFLWSVKSSFAADVLLKWEAAQFASGYKIYRSIDTGATWDAGTDVGDVLEYTYTGVPDSGLNMFRISVYNSYGETVTSWAGAWYNGDWSPPTNALGLRGDLLVP